MLAQTLVIEAAAEQAAGGLADQDGIGLRQCLQACGEVRRFADDRFFARGAAADNIADHDDAGCDADPSLQWHAIQPLDLPYRVDDRERSAHRAFGRVFVRLRITEIGKDAVAHEFGDITVETGNSAGAGILIAFDQAAQILGIERGGKRR